MKKKVLFPILGLVLALGLALPMAMPAGANPGTGLVALWHLDEGTGTTASDSSGNANHGTLYEASWTSGKFGNALSFDGTDDYVDFGTGVSSLIAGDYTVEAWVKPSSLSPGRNVAVSFSYMELGHNAGKVYFWQAYNNSWGKGYQYVSSSVLLDINNFSHIVGVFHKDVGIDLYVDGNYIGSDTTKTGTSPNIFGKTYAGVWYQMPPMGPGGGWFNGTVDEVRIWDQALTAEQVFQSYIAPVVTTEITSGESTVSVGAEESWNITINIYGGPEDVEDVVVQDGMGADLDNIGEVSNTTGDVTIAKKDVGQGKQKMRATMVTWDVGNLTAGESATLVVTVTTGYNPLRNNHRFQPKHEFTSADPEHELDGGASATYWYGDPLLEYETLETISLVVEVIDPPVLYLWPKNLSDWSFIYDTTYGVMDYNFQGPTFDFYFEGYNLTVYTDYSLIYYADLWPGDHPGALLGNGTTDSNGDITITGSIDFGHNLPTDPDANTDGAKIWLVLSDDYDGMKMIGWDPTEYLFEHNLINYYDTKI